jgi:hypothetical protein
MSENLLDFIESYQNTQEKNDHIFEHFTNKTNTISYLKKHRDYIELEKLGFGDRAFTYMWYLILDHIKKNGLDPLFLEIGVFKGQIISLWELISKELLIESITFGITPLKGNLIPKPSLLNALKYKLFKKLKADADSGNHYEETDYLSIIKNLFEHFNLPFDGISLIKGYSTEAHIISNMSENKFSIIYIDGDHTFAGVTNDIQNYCPMIQKGGFLIMDDASCNLPGSKFWKGHQSVSDACKIIENFSFKNVLNVGHNRIYQKL